jgi:hypothetical protein
MNVTFFGFEPQKKKQEVTNQMHYLCKNNKMFYKISKTPTRVGVLDIL